MLSNGITVVFALVTFGLALWYWHSFYAPVRQREEELKRLTAELRNYRSETIAAGFETLRKKMSEHPLAGGAWKKYDRTLLRYEADELWHVCSTAEAEEFFTDASFLGGINGNFWASLTGIFTGLGILGTFVGLTVGFMGLNFESGNPKDLMAGIQGLIGGASTAFLTSIFGLVCAIPFNYCHEALMKRFSETAGEFRERLDGLFPRKNAEDILLENQRRMDKQARALESMSEDIANNLDERLQTTLTDINENLKNSIKENFQPVFAELLTSIQQLNHSGIDGIVKGINAGAGTQMDQLAGSMEKTAGEMRDLSESMKAFVGEVQLQQKHDMEAMAEKMAAATAKMATVLENSARRATAEHDELVEGITQAMNANMAKLSASMEEMAAHLEQGSQTLLEAGKAAGGWVAEESRELTETMGTATGSLTKAAAHLENLHGEMQATLEKHQGAISGAESLVGSAAAAAHAFEAAASPVRDVTAQLAAAAEALPAMRDAWRSAEGVVREAGAAASAFKDAARPVAEVSEQLERAAGELPAVSGILQSARAVLDEARKTQASFETAAGQVSDAAGRLGTFGESLEARMGDLAAIAAASERNAGQIREALTQTEAAWKAYEDKFGTIRTDMDQTFEKLHEGLNLYQVETRKGLEAALTQFDSGLSKGVGQLASLADDVPDLTEAIERLSHAVGGGRK